MWAAAAAYPCDTLVIVRLSITIRHRPSIFLWATAIRMSQMNLEHATSIICVCTDAEP